MEFDDVSKWLKIVQDANRATAFRRPGRQPEGREARRNPLTTMVTGPEYELVRASAAKVGLSIAAYVRSKVLPK